VIDFRNTLILLSSNVGGDLIMKMCSGASRMPDPETIADRRVMKDPVREDARYHLAGSR
jgi:type VI secretion system protein VasG